METTNVMKAILTVLTFFILIVSGLGQTRNVVVGTNGAVVQPTNFWSADITNARNGLGLGSAATNSSSSFQPSSSVLSNVSSSNAINLTNLQASNISGVMSLLQGGTGATNATNARTALGLGSAATNSSSAFQPSSLVLSNLSLSNAGGLTNISAVSIVGTVALASNITGTAPLASNVTGVVSLANGGTAGTNEASARVSLGATTIGANLFTLPNPDDVRFLRINANNTVSSLSVVDFRNALSVGTNNGTVTSVGLSVPNIFSLNTSTITSSGTFTLGLTNQSSRQVFIAPNGGGTPAFRALDSDDLPSLAISKISGLQTALDGKLSTSGTAALATNITGIVSLANGGTGGTNAASSRYNLGATTVGENIFSLVNPSAIRFLRINADNSVSSLSDTDFRNAIGLGSSSTNASSAFQPSSTILSNLANSNGAGLTNLTAANITGTVALASNVSGVVALVNGGSGATTAGGARTNLGLGTAATNSALAFQPSSMVLSNLANSNAVDLTNITISNLGTIPVAGGGTGATNTSVARTNLGLGATWLTNTNISVFRTDIGLSLFALTNTNVANFRTAIGLGSGDNSTFAAVTASTLNSQYGGMFEDEGAGDINVLQPLNFGGNAGTTRINLGLSLAALTNTSTSNFRSAIGLGWIALTNSNSGNSIISYNSNNNVIVGIVKTNNISFSNSIVAPMFYGSDGTSTNIGGSINIGGNQSGSIDLSGANVAFGGTGGSIIASGTYSSTGGTLNMSGSQFGNGGSITTKDGGGSIDTRGNGTVSGGSIDTSLGGGLISTRGTGTLELGTNGARTTLTGTATTNRSISLPDANGTLALLTFSALTNTNAANFRSAISLGWPALTNTNAVNFRTAIELGATWLTNTNIAYFRESIGLGPTNEVEFNSIVATNVSASYLSGALLGTIKIVDSATTNAFKFENPNDIPYVRTNIGLGANWLTNTNTTNFRSAIGLSLAALTNTNTANFRSDIGLGLAALTNTNITNFRSDIGLSLTALTNTNTTNFRSAIGLSLVALTNTNTSNFRSDIGLSLSVLTNTNILNFRSDIGLGLSVLTNTNVANFRSDLGLGWSALTNSNSGTSLVSVDTNGTVVSPTNFWQVAPIQTLVQTFVPVVNSNSYATNARNLYVYSMGTNIINVTNTVFLPTNSATFNGDTATITHEGFNNTVTSIKQLGSATNFTTISNYSESVKFIREAGQWTFYHNISYVEPIRFTDGNIEDNRAISRTNLGLGLTALTNTNTTNFQVAIFSTNTAPTNTGNMTFGSAVAWMEINIHTNGTTNSYRIPLFSKP